MFASVSLFLTVYLSNCLSLLDYVFIFVCRVVFSLFLHLIIFYLSRTMVAEPCIMHCCNSLHCSLTVSTFHNYHCFLVGQHSLPCFTTERNKLGYERINYTHKMFYSTGPWWLKFVLRLCKKYFLQGR